MRGKREKKNPEAAVDCIALSCDFHCETDECHCRCCNMQKKKSVLKKIVVNDGCMSHVHILLTMEEINLKIYTVL